MTNKLPIDYKEFTALTAGICRNLSLDEWRPDYIVGLTRGGLLPAVMISHYLDVPMHTLKVSLRDDTDTESNCWMADDAFSGKNILIVDDINDTGATINWIMSDWQASSYPNDSKWDEIWGNNVRFAVIVDNLASQSNLSAHYVGMEVNKAEHDVWIDFPYEDWWLK
jgi:hypoxanthine phosphoribosyltransferase